MSLNIILPCAGKGSRLGLPYPKEIHLIEHDLRLIDLSFRLCLPYRNKIDRITITLNSSKHEIVSCLDKWSQSFNIVFCYFNNQYEEWPGSILSAKHLFLENNIVLLPDSRIIEYENYPLVPSMLNSLKHDDLVFAFIKEQSKRLENLGAISIDDNLAITGFCDKPKSEWQKYNAFWGSFGFKDSHSKAILEMMMKSVQKQVVDLNQLNLKVTGFPIAQYDDLGTWENIGLISSKAPIII
jgi:hypothetical protein